MEMKNYLIDLLNTCVPDGNAFAREAIDYAIQNGTIKLTYNMDLDTRHIGEHYDSFVEYYQKVIQ